ncbi:MAG: hypothetical protein QOK15_2049, partial [Nocardioidaceae bacterium]|nr:hypothetical protein [Nocardioidaceae bacterium]
PWSGDLRLTSPERTPLQPIAAAVQMRLAESRLAAASSAGDRATAQARVDFVRRNISELIFDLRCRNGHSTLRTMPQIARALRRTPGQWVDPGAGRT